jgi:hypothetical protein
MKSFIPFALIIVLCTGFISCMKTTAPGIAGKWSVINDSSFLAGNGIFQGGGSNYIGVSSDYYDFRPDGNLYIKEETVTDTGKYNMVSVDQVKIIYLSENGTSFGPNGGIRGTYLITNHTAHNLTLTLSGLTPEGEEFEVINLKK